jgi:vacuolar protein sorting-associated protein 35
MLRDIRIPWLGADNAT